MNIESYIIIMIIFIIIIFFRLRKMTTHYGVVQRERRPVTVIQDGDSYMLGLKNHIHPAEPGIHIAIKVKTEVSEV